MREADNTSGPNVSSYDAPKKPRKNGGPIVLKAPQTFKHPIFYISPSVDVLEKSLQAKILHLQNKTLLDSIFGNDSALALQVKFSSSKHMFGPSVEQLHSFCPSSLRARPCNCRASRLSSIFG